MKRIFWSLGSLTSLDVSNNPNLEILECDSNYLTSLDVSNNPNLKSLNCRGNKLTSLDISNAPNLKSLDCYGNNLTSLSVSNHPSLENLRCDYNKQLTSLNVNNNPNLKVLSCVWSQLTSLNVNNNSNLKELYCHGNQLTSLNVNNNPNLEILFCSNNQLTNIPNLRGAQRLSLVHNSYDGYTYVSTSFTNNYLTESELRSKLPEHLLKETRWLDEQIKNQKAGTIKEIKYTITFDANGGSVSTKSKVVEAGRTYGTLPIPTRTGHTFLGWYTAKSGGNQITSNTTVNISSNQTLYAQWNNNQYTVNFDANGGSVSTKSKEVEVGKTYGTLPTSTRTGHTFLGWYTAKSGGSKITSNTTANISSNQTLYAQWGKQYKVTFNANGGKVTKESATVVMGTTYGTLPKPTRKNYTFKGWYTAKKGGKKIEAGTQVKLTKNQTLYARWSLRTYAVKFNANKGTSGKMKNLKLTHGKTKRLTANKFKRKGYQFVGWNTKANGKGKTYKNKAVVKNKNLTLYAQWKRIKK